MYTDVRIAITDFGTCAHKNQKLCLDLPFKITSLCTFTSLLVAFQLHPSIHQETHSSSVTSSISSGGTVSDFQASWEIKSLQCVLRLPQNSLPVVQARNTSFRRHSGSILVRSLNHLHWLNIGSSKQPFEGNLFLSLVFVISFFLSLTRGHGVWWEWKHRLTGKSQLHF